MKDGLTLLCIGIIAYGLYHEHERWLPHAKRIVTSTTTFLTLPDATPDSPHIEIASLGESSVPPASAQDPDFARRVVESQRMALAKYPTLGSVGEEINSRFVFRYKLLLSEHSSRLQDPNWPMQLADECAEASCPVTTKTVPAPPHVPVIRAKHGISQTSPPDA